MVASRQIPQEIVDLIIDIAVSQAGSPCEPFVLLRACSLVSRAFHSRTRIHFFKDIDILFDARVQKRSRNLLDVLRLNQDLIPRVQSLTITFAIPYPSVGRIRRIVHIARKWKPGRSNFTNLLQLVTQAQLQALTFNKLKPTSETTSDWRQITASDPGAQTLLSSLSSLPSLRILRVNGLTNVPASLIVRSVNAINLQELMIHNTVVSKGAGEDTKFMGHLGTKANRTQPRLKALYLVHRFDSSSLFHLVIDLIGDPSTSFLLERVTHLTISSPDYGDLLTFWEILKGLKCLESINFIINFSHYLIHDFRLTVDLDQLRRLQSLQLTIEVLSPEWFPYGFETIAAFLSSTSSPLTNMRSLEFFVRFRIPERPFGTGRGGLGGPPPNQWENVDKILVEGGLYPNLQSVVVNLTFYLEDGIPEVGVEEEGLKQTRTSMMSRNMRRVADAARAGLLDFQVNSEWSTQKLF